MESNNLFSFFPAPEDKISKLERSEYTFKLLNVSTSPKRRSTRNTSLRSGMLRAVGYILICTLRAAISAAARARMPVLGIAIGGFSKMGYWKRGESNMLGLDPFGFGRWMVDWSCV